jgi:hypothetical protein
LFLACFSSGVILVSLAYGSQYDVERLDPSYGERLYAPQRRWGGRRSFPISVLVLLFARGNAAVTSSLRPLRIVCCVFHVLLAALLGVLTQVL